MKYSRIPLNSPFLCEYAFDLYEIRTKEECIYTTAPNGIIGLSIILEGHMQTYQKGKWSKAPTASIFGLIRQPQLIKISSNFREIAIGFRPYFLQLLLSENMSDLSGGHNTDAYTLFCRQEVDRLCDSLSKARSNACILPAVEHFIKSQLQLQRNDQRLYTAVHLISSLKTVKVEDLASRLNISSASLRNHFREKVGISPKKLIRLSRIREALHQNINSVPSLTTLGYDLGYFDQAHFIHDFKTTIGLAPGKYFNNKELIFDFYNFGRWKGDKFGLHK